MESVWILLHKTKSNNSCYVDAIPCANFETAKSIMEEMTEDIFSDRNTADLISRDGYSFRIESFDEKYSECLQLVKKNVEDREK